MILFDLSTRSLQVGLAGAVTTNQLPIVASWLDIAQGTFTATFVGQAANTILTNSTTPVIAVNAPGSNITRQLKYLSIQNADTAPATVIVQYNDNASLRTIVSVTLQVNETLSFDADAGWQSMTAAGALKTGVVAAGATSTSTIAAPAAPNSTTNYTMQGLAGSIIPRTTGNILVSIAGTITAANATTVDIGILMQGSYGTGAAPTTNAALTGTQAGAVQDYTWPVAPTAVGDVHYGFNVLFLIPSAIVGTPLWLDLAAQAVTTASDAPLVNVVITAVEL